MSKDDFFKGKGNLQVSAQDYIQFMFELKNQFKSIIDNQNKIIEEIKSSKAEGNTDKGNIKVEASGISGLGGLDGLATMFMNKMAGDVEAALGKNK